MAATITLRDHAAAEFARHLRAVAIAASDDDARPVLACVRLRSDGESTRITATDSYRLHEVSRPANGLPAGLDVLFPTKLVESLPDVDRWSRLSLTVEDDRVSIAVDEVTISAKVPSGWEPVDTDSLLDTLPEGVDEGQVKAFNPSYLADIFKAAETFAGYGQPVRVRHLDPTKAARFEVVDNAGYGGAATLSMLLMPVRIP